MKRKLSLALKRYGILILVACIFVVSMLQSLRDIHQSQSIAIEVTALDYWNASQARFELERVISTLDALAAEQERLTKDDLIDRVDIFWSRLTILYEGDRSIDIVALTNAEVTVPAIMDRIEELDASLASFSPTDREAYDELRRVFSSFRQPMHDILLHIHQARGVGQTTLSQQLDQLYTLHMVSLIGALMSGIGLIVLLTRSIGRAKRAQQVADEARREFEAIVNALPLSVDVVDSEGRLILLNDCAQGARGIGAEPWKGRQPAGIGRSLNDEHNRQVVISGRPMAATEILVYRTEQTPETWLVSKVPLLDPLGVVCKVITAGVDITAQKEAEGRIRDLAHHATHDALTGLPNRPFLHDHLASALDRCARDRRQLALLSIDFDRFKEVNDRFGHEAGDHFLIEASERLARCLPRSAIVTRLGGDEFAVIQEDVSDAIDVRSLALELLAAFKEPVEIGEQNWFSTISLGASLTNGVEVDQQRLLKHADLALYEAKERGGNTFCLYDPAMHRRHLYRFGLQQDLRRAIVNEELVLHYQPKIRVLGYQLTGFEALLRWHHPEKGSIEPSVFVRVAEECDLIEPLGEWVLKKTCAQLAAWQQAGFAPAPVAINLSAVQFLRQDMAGLIKRTLAETGVSPSLLELEVSESVLVEHSGLVRDMLGELQTLKLGITLDNFGTGYSSLSSLQTFPIDKIKIDKSFVQAIVQGRDEMAIIRAIIALAHSLNIKVIAEGVETEEQRRVLEQIDCDEIQGFLVGRARPPIALTPWMSPSQALITDVLPDDQDSDVVTFLRRTSSSS